MDGRCAGIAGKYQTRTPKAFSDALPMAPRDDCPAARSMLALGMSPRATKWAQPGLQRIKRLLSRRYGLGEPGREAWEIDLQPARRLRQMPILL